MNADMFNNDVYQNHSPSCSGLGRLGGDQVALFYCEHVLDHSETSMLVSAGFEKHRPINSLKIKTLKHYFNAERFFH